MQKSESNYRSYLVRLWHEDYPQPCWRALVEEIGVAGRRQYFKDLESLVLFLLERPAENSGKEELLIGMSINDLAQQYTK
jgi:hypothetical protein